MKWVRLSSIFLAVFCFSFYLSLPVVAVDCEGDPPSGYDKAKEIKEYVDSCMQKIDSLKGQQQTLKATITTLSSKINLTQGQINQTIAQIEQLEKEIATLGTVLTDLNASLNQLTSIFVARVRESYKHRYSDPLRLFFSTSSFTDFLTQLHYLKTLKKRDQLIMVELERARLDYNQQKTSKEEKQTQIETLKTKLIVQQASLATQKQEKQSLLVITQNDERKYQDLLAKARSELEAIEAIIAGKGTESEVGDIQARQTIATVISGSSCNSSGSHLHFMVADGSTTVNPFSYLKSVDYKNCSGSSCGSSDSDPFNPSGNWDWPLDGQIEMYQGYGETWAVKNSWVRSIYSFHNGVDINGSSNTVKAVQAGKLYRGSYTGSKGCALKYVRVDHKDSGLDTYYLHVNYF